jgi:UDP-glucose 4-epimerase
MRPGPYAGVVYKFIHALLSDEAPVIYGDGLQTRDFVYVEDVAEAHAKALASKASGVFNIGSGVETSILSLYKMVCSLVGRCPDPRKAQPRRGDVRRSVADITRAKEGLGWTPRTSLREGLASTIKHFKAEAR